MFKRKRSGLLVVTLAGMLAGCATFGSDPMGMETFPAMTSQIDEHNMRLRTLPAPATRVRVAVYDFPDLTGQYRERDNVQTLSRAVSQGGSAVLIQALQDAGEGRWFSVLDRANLEDLLRERQIVSEMRRIYRDEERPDPGAVPPMRHAGIILQGAIIGYDTNTQTGGFGARYLGIGGDTRWKLDIVTVSLRAVSSESGEVLASVIVEKPIASTSLRGGVFSYVALDRLLEIETGTAANEPKQIALRMAIETAVASLIMEGADVGLWHFGDRSRGEALLREYRADVYRGTTIPTDRPRRVAPETRNAARVVDTRPVPRPALPPVQERRLEPAQSAPTPPPPMGNGEVLG